MTATVLWLGDPACHDPTLVGGKAANLSRLAAHYTVPAGFCLTTATVDQPLEAGALAAAYVTLAQRCGEVSPPVAVRSSGIEEDGALASFAGQHETYLNVVGVRAVIDAVARCRSSAATPRSLAYRTQHGLAGEEGRPAVLVQRLVLADVSAVVFSANPLTGNRDEAMITASWGLGESIVGGTVTPDTYLVRKVDLTVVTRRIAEKERMTVLVVGGTSEVGVPRFLRGRPALDDPRAIEVARLAWSLEETMGWPVDVECAWHGDTVSVLQCRPITTLAIGRARSL